MNQYSRYKKIVIKIGTNTLAKNNSIDVDYIKDIARQASAISKSSKLVIITSGAIGFGKMERNISGKIEEIKLRQALAAIGQGILMSNYYDAFKKHDLTVAQMLLTYDVFKEKDKLTNFNSCLDSLMKMEVIPIINENDVISTDEIGFSFGDNDHLSALVASNIHADLLIILTDIDGLYTADPKEDSSAKKIDLVDSITDELVCCASGTLSTLSKGGMRSKIAAAKIAVNAGCNVIIANGREKDLLLRISEKAKMEKIGTFFACKRG